MTQEQKDNWAHVCAELTDDLPSKIQRIGGEIVRQMELANRQNDYADAAVHTMGRMLMFLGIPYKSHKDGNIYRAAEIAGEMYVADSSQFAESGAE